MPIRTCLATLALLALAPLPAHAEAATAPAASLAETLRKAKFIDTSGDPDAALKELDALLLRARAAKDSDPVDLLYAEAARAGALFWLRRYADALAAYQQVDAELTRRKAPMTPDRAELINNIGSVLSILGRGEEALAAKQRALAITEKLTGKESIEYGSALYGIGLIEFRAGRPLDALPRVVEALRISRLVAERTGENLEKPAIYGLSLSALQIQTGATASGLDSAREAALWAESKLGENHRVTMAALNQLGASLSDAGLYAQAIPVLRRTTDLRAKSHPADHPDMAVSYHALGYALDNAGFKDEARPFYAQAQAIFEKTPDVNQPIGAATTLGQLARLDEWRGDAASGLALRERALKLARERSPSPDHPDLLFVEINLARSYLAAGRLAEAGALADHAAKAYAAHAVPTNYRRMAGAVTAAQVLSAQGKPQEALELALAALAPGRARLLDRATPRGELYRLAGQYGVHFTELTRMAMAAGQPAVGFEALQLANLGDLQSAFSALSGLQAGNDPEALDAIRRYQALAVDGTRLRRELNAAVAAGQTQKSDTLDAQIAAIDARLREADKSLAALVPGYAALSAIEPARLAEAQARLRPGQAMLLYGQDDEGLIVLAVTRDTARFATSSIAPARLIELQRRLRRSIDEGLAQGGETGFDRQAAWELYQLLIPASLRPLLKPMREIEVLPTGSLAALPFAALVTQKPRGRDDDPQALRRTRWLALDHAISAPITASPLPRRSPAAQGTLRFAGIGAPLLAEVPQLAAASPAPAGKAARLRSGDTSLASLRELPSLPAAARELEGMAKFFPASARLLIGKEATERAVKAMPLEQFDVLAFATHGLVGGALRDLVEPALVMTPPASAQPDDDGLLTASEVAKLRLNAEWVILSACDTSAGESANAPTYSGLARGFVTAGARSLLLSHWPVRDDVATRLTLGTLEGAAHGLSRPEALRRAQLAIMADRKLPGSAHPASWAPFVLVGD